MEGSRQYRLAVEMDQHFYERIRRATDSARGRWRDIFINAGIQAQLVDGKARPCPLCGGRDRFVFDDKHGRGNYFCRQCGPGDGFALLGQYLGYNFRDALVAVENFCGLTSWNDEIKVTQNKREHRDAEVVMTPEKLRRIEMMELWAQAQPIQAGDPVFKYLSNRGLNPEKAAYEVRYHSNLSYSDDEGRERTFPAMLARVVDREGCVVNLHRTYLTAEGSKAPVDKVKKLMPGEVRGACVRFGAYPTQRLNLAEGIETALAVAGITGNPTWATLGCTNLKNLEYIPEGVTRVDIFADHDINFAGQSAAYTLAHRLAVKGYEVEVHIPKGVATDWLDEALARELL